MTICTPALNQNNSSKRSGSKNNFFIIPDWTTLDITQPYFDPTTNSYRITVDTSVAIPGSNDNLQNIMNSAKNPGVIGLLTFYNKVQDQNTIDKLVAVAQAVDYYVPARPNPMCDTVFNMKVLIAVPKDIFEAIHFIQDVSNTNVKLPLANLEIQLVSSTLQKQISNVVNILNRYSNDVSEFDGQVIGINLNQEAVYLKQFVDSLNNLLIANGLQLRTNYNDSILIGTNNAYKILYVLINQGNGFLNLTVDFNQFLKQPSVSNDRTVGYLSKLSVFESLAKTSITITWVNFLQKYTVRPPTIKPSTVAPALTPAQKNSLSQNDVNNQIARFNSKSYKTEEEKEEEDRHLLSPQLRATIYATEGAKADFVGDEVLSDYDALMKNINTLDDVYGGLLNKIGIKALIAGAINCLAAQLPVDLIQLILLLSKLTTLPCDQLIDIVQNQLNISIANLPKIDGLVRQEVMACIKNLGSIDLKETLDAVSKASGLPIVAIDDLGRVDPDTIIKTLGPAISNRILRAICDSNRQDILNALPSIPNINLDITIPDLFDFTIPTINLPDGLPTIDIDAALVDALEAAILDALVSGIIGMIKGILQQIIQNCGDLSKVNFGQANINNLISNSINAGINTPEFQNSLNSVLNATGAASSIDQFVGIELMNLMDDLSAILSPAEISKLLNGNPNNDTIKLINCLVKNKYPTLVEPLGSQFKIGHLFGIVGNLVDKQTLLEQIGNSPSVAAGKALCDIIDNSTKNQLLDKGLTPDQVDQQLNAAKQRKLATLQSLANLLNNPTIQIPPVFCTSGSAFPSGLVAINPPSFLFLLDKTIDTIYDGVHIAFDSDISGFPASLKQDGTQKVKRQVPRQSTVNITGPDGSTTSQKIETPEFRRLISQGVSVPDPNNLDGDPVTVYEDSPINSTYGQSYVAQGLRNNLLNIETNSALLKVDNGMVKLTVPLLLNPTDQQPINTKNLPDSFLSSFNQISDSLKEISVAKNIILYQTPPSPVGLQDNFSIDITYQSGSGTPQNIFSYQSNADLDSNIQNFITTNNLVESPVVSSQEGYFSSFVANIWAGGASIYRDYKLIQNPSYATGLGSTSTLSIINGDLRNIFEFQPNDPVSKPNIYANLFKDMIANISRQITNSPVFRADILSLVNFTPALVNGCDPGLLNLANIKNNMKKSLLDSECMDMQNPLADGLSKTELNPLEESGIDGAVKTFVRLFTIELVMRAIFAFSEFKIESIDKIDSIVLSYINNSIEGGINNLATLTKDYKFQQQFVTQTIQLYNKELGKDNPIDDYDVAIKALIKEQLPDVISRINNLIGTKGELDIYNILIEDWLPLFEVFKSPKELRLATTKNATVGKAVNVTTQRTIRNNSTQNAVFNLDNGTFILERYIRIEEIQGSGLDTPNNDAHRTENLFGVVNLDAWSEFIASKQFFNKLKTKPIEKLFKSWNYGLRLVYVPPTTTQLNGQFLDSTNIVPSFSNNPFQQVISNNPKDSDASLKDKSFDITEQVIGDTTTKDPVTGIIKKSVRKIFSFPLVSVETSFDISNLNNLTVSFYDAKADWVKVSDKLSAMLEATSEFNFLFSYLFPINRIVSLMTIYNMLYLSNIKNVQNLFNGTKMSLKTVFQALLNSGIYKYQDSNIRNQGGNAGLATTAQNNTNTSPDIPGMSLASIAARTPILILKGLTELIDPNISVARKIVDTAKQFNKNIPIVLASLGQLPVNVFGPFPMGIGIGPPITPLGFIYLGLDIDGIFDSAQGKQMKRDSIDPSLGINLNNSITTICPDTIISGVEDK